MGIDRIGKGGVPPQVPESQGTSSVDKQGPVEKTFSSTVGETEAARAREQATATSLGQGTTVDSTSPLARFRAGEVDVNGYVDLKVDEVVSRLHGLSPAEIDDIRKMLRDQIATDPGLSDLVRTATGQVPSPPED